jgi:hypothetical protein
VSEESDTLVKHPIAITDLPLEDPTQVSAGDRRLVVTGPIG